jgi:hypothetical protein
MDETAARSQASLDIQSLTFVKFQYILVHKNRYRMCRFSATGTFSNSGVNAPTDFEKQSAESHADLRAGRRTFMPMIVQFSFEVPFWGSTHSTTKKTKNSKTRGQQLKGPFSMKYGQTQIFRRASLRAFFMSHFTCLKKIIQNILSVVCSATSNKSPCSWFQPA